MNLSPKYNISYYFHRNYKVDQRHFFIWYGWQCCVDCQKCFGFPDVQLFSLIMGYVRFSRQLFLYKKCVAADMHLSIWFLTLYILCLWICLYCWYKEYHSHFSPKNFIFPKTSIESIDSILQYYNISILYMLTSLSFWNSVFPK